MTILLPLFLFCRGMHAQALAPAAEYLSAEELEFIEDPGGKLALADVMHAPWTRAAGPGGLNLGFQSSVYWLRITLPKNLPEREWILTIENPLMDEVDAWTLAHGSHRRGGILTPFSLRERKERLFSIPVPVEPGVGETVFVRVSMRAPMALPVSLRTPAAASSRESSQLLIYGFMHGAIVIMLVYHLFLFFVLRERSYLLYALVLFFGSIFMLAQNGLGFMYFWPGLGGAALLVNLSSIALQLALSGLLISSFLNLKRHWPLAHSASWIAAVLALACGSAAWFVPYQWAARPLAVFIVAFSLVALLISGRLSLAGHKHARFFALSYFAIVAAHSLFALRALGLVPASPSALGAVMLGTMLHMALLSFALGDRVTELRDESNDAKRASESKSRFLATMSHEIRTPLNGVMGLIILLLDTPLEEKQKGMVLSMRRAAGALLAVINDILDYSRIEAGSFALVRKPFDIRELLTEVESLLRPLATEKGITIRSFADDSTGGSFLGDPLRLRQILLNLAGNAVKFTERGSVSMTASWSPGEVSTLDLEVRDTGIGIPPDQQQKLFQPFFQVDAGFSRRFAGSGLGLAIVKQIVHQMNGTISLASEPGTGTVVRLSIPLEAAAGRALQNEAALEPQRNLSGLRALVADDDAIGGLVSRQMLEKLGLEVDLVTGGKGVMEKLAECKYDLVFLDMHMPDMDGVEAAKAVRAGHRPPPILIALTANVLPEHRSACIEAGMSDFLTKPVTPADFRAVIDRQLPAGPGP